jgi:hypothetical protein
VPATSGFLRDSIQYFIWFARERAEMTAVMLRLALMTLVSFIPAALGAQGVLADEDGKAANERKKVAARAKQADAFFAATEPLDITLTTNIRRIRGDKEDKAPWRLAVFSYSDTDGKVVTIPAQIRTRGIWRLKNCEFPPLRVNFRNEDTKGTLLRGIDKPKLVNYCRNTDAFETYITQEMQLYRVYNLLTPASHRARMLRITYVDSASGKTHAKRLAILLEEPDFIAARLDGDIIEHGARPRVGRVDVGDLGALGQVVGTKRNPHRAADHLAQVVDGAGAVGADVEGLVVSFGPVDRVRDGGRHVRDVTERAGLRPVAEEGQPLAAQDLVHEDADHVAIAIPDVLPLAIHVMGPEDDVP